MTFSSSSGEFLSDRQELFCLCSSYLSILGGPRGGADLSLTMMAGSRNSVSPCSLGTGGAAGGGTTGIPIVGGGAEGMAVNGVLIEDILASGLLRAAAGAAGGAEGADGGGGGIGGIGG